MEAGGEGKEGWIDRTMARVARRQGTTMGGGEVPRGPEVEALEALEAVRAGSLATFPRVCGRICD